MEGEPLGQLAKVISESRETVRDEDILFFAGLSEQEIDSIFPLWSKASFQRKNTIISRLVAMSKENVDLEFIAFFKRCTQDLSSEVRESAIAGLWESEDRGIVPLLLTCLSSDPDPRVRAAAAFELGRFVTLAEERKLLARDSDVLYEGLMGALTSVEEVSIVRRRSLESISAFTSMEVDKWIAWAHQQGGDFHQSALYAMGRTCDSQWISWILQDLDSMDPSIRCEAVNACKEIGGQLCVPKLMSLVEDEELEVQIAAIWALASVGGDQIRIYLEQVSNSIDNAELVEVIQAALSTTDLDELPVSAVNPLLNLDNRN